MICSSILDHFSWKSILFSQYNWGYLTRSNLELGILIFPGCCKKVVYQYVVMLKMYANNPFPRQGLNPGQLLWQSDAKPLCYWWSWLLVCKIDTTENENLFSSNGGSQKFLFKENVGNVSSVLNMLNRAIN
jgi:hypothetical protein